MLLLAHMGITLAAARQLEKSAVWRGSIYTGIDYRIVLLGSMLPDIIDKPLGGIILKEALGNGRIYSHTLIFLLILLGAGFFLWTKHKRSWGLVLSGGSFIHHFLDGMWQHPETFLWPAFGLGFPAGNSADWLSLWLKGLLSNPVIFVPEIIGGMFILRFLLKLASQTGIKKFIKTGRLSEAPGA